MKLTGTQQLSIGIFLFFLVGLIVIFNGITPWLFRKMPNDFVRTKLIINTLNDPDHTPGMVIFGNSRAMSGVNGYLLQEQLPDHPLTYSFTSTSQYMSESALFYTSLPSSVHTVLQCIDIQSLSQPIDMKISNQVALHMYGYKMDDQTKSFAFSLYKKLNKSDWYYNFHARDCLFSGMNVWLRNLLDDDVSEISLEHTLHYAMTQTSDRNEAVYEREILHYETNDSFKNYTILPEWKELIEASYQYIRAKNIKYYFVVMPHNPDVLPTHQEERERAFSMFREEFDSIPVINCMDILSADDFYDAIHPNQKGAAKLTQHIIQYLQ